MKSAALAVIVILLLVPGSHAASRDASATSLLLEGDITTAGDMYGLTVNGVEAGQIGALRIDAERGYILRWTYESHDVMVGGAPIGQSLDPESERIPRTGSLGKLHLDGGAHDMDHLVNFIALGDAKLIFHARAADERASTTMQSASSLCLGRNGLEAGACAGYSENDAFPTDTIMPSPAHRIDSLGGGRFEINAGRIAIDVQGLDLSGDVDLPGRDETTPVAGPAQTSTFYFTRLVLEGARISFAVDGAHDQVAWAGSRAATVVEGTITATDGDGFVRSAGEKVPLREDTVLEGHHDIVSEALAGRLFFGLSDVESQANPVPSAGLEGGGWYLAGLASLLPLAGVALLARRASPHASMSDVEAALSAGRFGRAARLAGRIIRRNPADESAQLGRAIALTKAGRPAQAVAGLDALLQHHKPADGTLHYALGVALFEMGRPQDARSAMATAVERTPALLGDVSPELQARYDGGAYS